MTSKKESTGWLLFNSHYDHRHGSGAVSEFNAGGKYRVTREIEKDALAAGVAEVTEKPADDDPAYVAPAPRVKALHQPLADRRTPPKVARGGHDYGKPGNPETLPDPTDPEAIHEGTVTADEAKQREKDAKEAKDA